MREGQPRNAAKLLGGDGSRTMSHLVHRHHTRDPVTGQEQGGSQSRETRKKAHHLFHFHFEHRTGKKDAQAQEWRNLAGVPVTTNDRSDLGQVILPWGSASPPIAPVQPAPNSQAPIK